MAKGMYLRTNYRQTGGVPNITALGGGIPLSSNAGSVGTDVPYGGFMFLSYSGTCAGDSNVAGLPGGTSFAIRDSAYGWMSLYYGCNAFNSGYVFWPCGWEWLSISDVANTDACGALSAPFMLLMNMATSGSVTRMSFAAVSTAGSTLQCASCTGARLLIWGFIVSSP